MWIANNLGRLAANRGAKDDGTNGWKLTGDKCSLEMGILEPTEEQSFEKFLKTEMKAETFLLLRQVLQFCNRDAMSFPGLNSVIRIVSFSSIYCCDWSEMLKE